MKRIFSWASRWTFDPELLLDKASKHLGFDINAARNAKKIAPEDKANRDMLVYLL